MVLDFFIICTGFNCAKNVRLCFNSLVKQTYTNFQAILISDGSGDTTRKELDKLYNIDARINVKHYSDNYGAAMRRYEAINNYTKAGKITDETVIILVGLDDQLLPTCLELVQQQYQQGKWMTYGNWINQRGIGLPIDFPLDFEHHTHINRDYRKVKYRSTAPNTFYKFLFDKIPVQDFKIKSKWIDTTTESEVMFSCLEMCGQDRIGIIYEPIYIYNQMLPGGTINRLGADYKKRTLNTIINRPKKDLLIR